MFDTGLPHRAPPAPWPPGPTHPSPRPPPSPVLAESIEQKFTPQTRPEPQWTPGPATFHTAPGTTSEHRAYMAARRPDDQARAWLALKTAPTGTASARLAVLPRGWRAAFG